MYKYETIIPKYQLETPQIVRIKVLNVIGDLIDNHKLKDFVLEQDLLPLDDMELHKELDNYTTKQGLYCYCGNVVSYTEMKEILKDFRKLIIRVESLTHQHEDKGE